MSAHRFSFPTDVAVVADRDAPEDPAQLYVAMLPSGPMVVLKGSGALIWHAVAAGGPTVAPSEDEVVDRVALEVNRPADDIRGDVVSFLAGLVDRGLLERLLPAHDVLRLRVLDTVFRLEVPDSELAERLRDEWLRCLIDVPDQDEVVVPVQRGTRPLDAAGYQIASRLTREAIEAARGRYVMFHAAALADAAGRTVVLVAPSGTGKTTAAATLAASRFGYLTDETVAIAADGRVVPYPKPLSLVHGSGGKVQRGPDELGLRPAPAEPHVHRIVLLERMPDDGAPRLDRVPLLDAVLELLPQISALPALDRPLQRLLEVLDRCSGVFRLAYREVAETEELLTDLLNEEQPPGEPESWSALDDVGNGDGVRIGDEALLLAGTTPVRLSAIGLTIWRAAMRGGTLDDLVQSAVQEHGPHPDAAVMVREAVRSMQAFGVLPAVSDLS